MEILLAEGGIAFTSSGELFQEIEAAPARKSLGRRRGGGDDRVLSKRSGDVEEACAVTAVSFRKLRRGIEFILALTAAPRAGFGASGESLTGINFMDGSISASRDL